MGLFDLFSRKSVKPDKARPYKEEALNKIYDLLFCDNIGLYKSDNKSSVYPWDILLAERPDIDKLKRITTDKNLEARQKVLAYNLLAANGSGTAQKELFAVIVEVALPKGLDVLAAFSDGTARYLNHAEKLLVWETRTEKSNELIRVLFSESVKVVNIIGPSEEERRPFPAKGMARLTFLVSNGLYFGEGPFEVMQTDPMSGPVIHGATQLMGYLTSQPVK